MNNSESPNQKKNNSYQHAMDFIQETSSSPRMSLEFILDSYTSKQQQQSNDVDLDQIHVCTQYIATPFHHINTLQKRVDYTVAYRQNIFLLIIFYVLCICTLGVLPLMCHWYPVIKLYMTHFKSNSKQHATTMLLQSSLSKQQSVVSIESIDILLGDDSHVAARVYYYRHACFIYDVRVDDFIPVTFNVSLPFNYIASDMTSGVDTSTRMIRKALFGSNGIRVEVKNPIALLLDEVLHPFYIFQLFSVILWCFEDYYVYAAVIFLSSSLSAILSLIETRRNLKNLREMAKHECEVNRYYLMRFEQVSSDTLVPGDIIELENDMLLPCDILLFSGECIVNESMLTGESIPIVKTALSRDSNDIYSIDKHKNVTLFAGTKIVQIKARGQEKVLGVCVRTGFETAKGKLVLSILYPRPSDFSFYRDSFKFIGVLGCISFIGMIYTIIKYGQMDYAAGDTIKRTLDLVTIAVPPALPVAVTVGTALAIRRLKRSKIYCISPPRVNVAGVINCMCFDKTGTLTEEGLDLNGIRVVDQAQCSEFIDASTIGNFIDNSLEQSSVNTIFTYSLTACHSLAIVDNKVIGDPLEQAIFEATKWEIHDPQSHHDEKVVSIVRPTLNSQDVAVTESHSNTSELHILKRFDFSSELKRMSVIIRDSGNNQMYCIVKGSPEHLQSLCLPHTVPHDFHEILFNYTYNGDRVLACAYKPIEQQDVTISRDEAESDVIFLGFIIMQNKMKSETPGIIAELNYAKIDNIMVTGDNSLTAVFIAKQSGIVHAENRVYIGDVYHDDTIQWKEVEHDRYLDPVTLKPTTVTDDKYDLAITGKAFEMLYTEFQGRDVTQDNIGEPPLFHKLLCSCKIYARMSPDQKRLVSEELQKIDYYVGFCGMYIYIIMCVYVY
jgi:cation-transporting ATPase 13A2